MAVPVRLPSRPSCPISLTTALARDERGVATVEYVTVLVLVSIVGAGAIVALGVPLIQLFRYVQMVIAMPVP
jgi:Flp pilus assembly pilin Flp